MHPQDPLLFAEAWVPALREAVKDLSYLLGRGYAEKAAQKIVGDHYQLDVRQRRAVLGASCPATALARRSSHRLGAEALAGQTICLDGYNVLIGAESALSGGILVRGCDGAIRDLASVHGSYRKVEETSKAIALIGRVLEKLGVAQAHWYFDAPVSNSGRLKTFIEDAAAQAGWPWHVELAPNPDRVLAASDGVVATSDSWILDRSERWVNLGALVVAEVKPAPRILDLGDPA